MTRFALTVAAAFFLAALLTSSAQAAFEQVGCFAGTLPGLTDSCKPVLPPPKSASEFGEEVQLGGTGGMAVNYTGAGGVPAGTVYAAGFQGGGLRIAMYVPDSGGGLKFSQEWEVTSLSELSYERCGPALGEKEGKAEHPCLPRVQASQGYVDVDVDQVTGNVYAFNGENLDAGRAMIVEYNSEGDEITRFGEKSPAGKTTAETPATIHECCALLRSGGIAVNGSGEVYVYDINTFDSEYHRLMKFRPKVPGKYDEYEYAGTSEDLGAGFSGEGRKPQAPVADATGKVYVAAEQSHIEAYDPASPGDPSLCDFEFKPAKITALTVNPETGEPYFFSYKTPKRIYQLGPCNEATGNFEGEDGEAIVDEFEAAPERDDLWGLALDPVAKFSPGRPAGVLYAAAPHSQPGSAVGVGEEGQSSLGYIFAPAEENPPEVEAQSVSSVTATSAQLRTSIDPKGFKTSYAFQYMTEAAYQGAGESFEGATEVPPGGAPLEGTGAGQIASAALIGLTSDTAYRWRVVASSFCSKEREEKEEACEAAGATESFHTFPAALTGLPDNRAWELVSPPQKNSGQVFPADPRISSCPSNDCKPGGTYAHFPMQSSPDGDAVAYEGTGFEPGKGGAIENVYVARRSVSGWQSTNPTPPPMRTNGSSSLGYMAFDPGLSEGVVAQFNPTLGFLAPPEYENLYAQLMADPPALTPLVGAQPPNRLPTGSSRFVVRYAGASADLSRVFFEANDALSEEAPGIAPASEDGGAAKFNLYEWERATGEVRLVNVFPGNATTAAGAAIGAASTNAISADGSRAFWSDEAGQVNVREGASATRAIPDPGKFLSASTDGSKVLLANGHLYDLESETITDLTEGKGGFQGVAGQSEDLSHVYFVDTEVLTGEEENSEGDKAQAGKFNLYVWGAVGPTTRYVATLVAPDNNASIPVQSKTWSRVPASRTAQASPAGRYLAFASQAPLTGFDNTGPCGGSIGGVPAQAPCSEAFLYDSASSELSCPSCNPSGSVPLGWSVLRRIAGSGDSQTLPQPRYLTDAGRLYFDSQDSLSLADTNNGVEDVYEYEPEGVGSCKRAGGCVYLISAGREGVDSNLLAIDASGKNVFFTTRDRLRPKDKDELVDLYDAREGGGPPSETETTRPECQGEACQPAAIVPGESNLASTSFQGPGSAKKQGGGSEARCPKGQRKVRRKGKAHCARKRHKRHHTRAAHAKRGGTK